MNTYIKMQIDNAIVFAQMFIKSCELAALKDDGTVSKEEERQLKELRKAAESFRKSLEKIK